jgi:hypothetical protein
MLHGLARRERLYPVLERWQGWERQVDSEDGWMRAFPVACRDSLCWFHWDQVVATAARHFYTANEERGRWGMGAQDEAEDGHINLLCSFETTQEINLCVFLSLSSNRLNFQFLAMATVDMSRGLFWMPSDYCPNSYQRSRASATINPRKKVEPLRSTAGSKFKYTGPKSGAVTQKL